MTRAANSQRRPFRDRGGGRGKSLSFGFGYEVDWTSNDLSGRIEEHAARRPPIHPHLMERARLAQSEPATLRDRVRASSASDMLGEFDQVEQLRPLIGRYFGVGVAERMQAKFISVDRRALWRLRERPYCKEM